MAVTVKDVAEYTGLSVPTVVQVLGSRAHLFRPETRERVLKAAEKLGYRPNSSAKAMRKGRFGAIGLLTSANADAGADDVHSRTMWAMLDELLTHDLLLTIGQMPDEKHISEGVVPKILREWSVDGLLINYSHDFPEAMLAMIVRYHIPSIWLNEVLVNDCVYPDDFSAIRQATEHLLRHGHKRIAYINYSNLTGDYSVGARFNGYSKAMQTADLPVRTLRAGFELPEDFGSSRRKELTAAAVGGGEPTVSLEYLGDEVKAIESMLSGPDRPTAVLSNGSEETATLLLAAAKHGLSVPKDLSIIAVRDNPARICGQDITTMEVPAAALGKNAIAMLLQKIKDPLAELPSQAVPYTFWKGATVARVS